VSAEARIARPWHSADAASCPASFGSAAGISAAPANGRIASHGSSVSEAGVDAALVSHHFGGKEGLLTQVEAGAFYVEEHLPESLDKMGEFLVAQVMTQQT
jgi:hypothetical protein